MILRVWSPDYIVKSAFFELEVHLKETGRTNLWSFFFFLLCFISQYFAASCHISMFLAISCRICYTRNIFLYLASAKAVSCYISLYLNISHFIFAQLYLKVHLACPRFKCLSLKVQMKNMFQKSRYKTIHFFCSYLCLQTQIRTCCTISYILKQVSLVSRLLNIELFVELTLPRPVDIAHLIRLSF